MPAVPSCILDPVFDQFTTLLSAARSAAAGRGRPRIDNRVVFDKLIQVLVFGAGYERVADGCCSATTLRRRRDEWMTLGLAESLRLAALDAYDKMIGLQLNDLPGDGCITKAPSGGQCAGPSPVDRRKLGLKRSQITDGYGVPLGTVVAAANVNDHTLLPATLDTLPLIGPLPADSILHLDAGYDNQPVRGELANRGLCAQIATRGVAAPIQVGKRWVVERTNSWLNNFGKIRRCTERRKKCVEFYISLACIIVTIRSLIRRAWYHYRRQNRPTNPRLR